MDNYVKQVYIAQELFQNYDQELLIRKFGLEHDTEYLYIEFVGRHYRIVRATGAIEVLGPHSGRIGRREGQAEREGQRDRLDVQAEEESQIGRSVQSETNGQVRQFVQGEVNDRISRKGYTSCLDFEVVMSIYDILCCSREQPQLSGEWCPVQSLQVTMSSPSPDRMTRSYAKAFSGHVEELKNACRALGGEQQSVPASADACYKLQLFPFFPVIVQFWDGDEEFEPVIMLLWDRRTLDFMHFETTYYVMGHLMKRLKELMGMGE